MRVFAAAVEAMQSGRPCALATVVNAIGSAPRHPGSRMLVYGDGSIEGTVGGGAFEERVRAEAAVALADAQPRLVHVDLGIDLGMACGGGMDVYIEPLRVQPQLLLFGAGHIGRQVADIAQRLGFHVTVFDDRPEQANEARFPGCDIRCGQILDMLADLTSTETTFILSVTHGHSLDEQVLGHFIERPWAWLGVIGSRTKIALVFEKLAARGVPEERLARVSAPVGLDIGAETPEEIAVAIVAEIVRTLRGCERVPLPLSQVRGRASAGTPVVQAT
jgi:xanthine dehydrogenase accessory factor